LKGTMSMVGGTKSPPCRNEGEFAANSGRTTRKNGADKTLRGIVRFKRKDDNHRILARKKRVTVSEKDAKKGPP